MRVTCDKGILIGDVIGHGDQDNDHEGVVEITESEVTVVTSLGGGVVISGGRANTLMKKSLYTYLRAYSKY